MNIVAWIVAGLGAGLVAGTLAFVWRSRRLAGLLRSLLGRDALNSVQAGAGPDGRDGEMPVLVRAEKRLYQGEPPLTGERLRRPDRRSL